MDETGDRDEDFKMRVYFYVKGMMVSLNYLCLDSMRRIYIFLQESELSPKIAPHGITS